MKIIIAILIFSVIIIIHELGHFLLAKKNGIGVVEFSLGMGPRIASFVRGGTRYSLKLLPIGGSCMMLGEDELIEDENSFNKKGIWARISVIAAGPIFNFILAFILAVIVTAFIGYDPAIVTGVEENSSAQQAGLMEGDIITKLDGKKVTIGRDISNYFQFGTISEAPFEIVVKRDGEKKSLKVTPLKSKLYRIGFSYTPDDTVPSITEVEENKPMAQAGLMKGDVITGVDGTEIKTGKELSEYMNANPLGEKAVKITYKRETVETTVEVTPVYVKDVYNIGFSYNTSAIEKASPIENIKYSAYEVKYWIVTTVKSLGQMIRGKVSVDDIAGPVGIVDMMGNIVDASKPSGIGIIIINLLSFSIIISANLGVMNLLPIPALDGGRLVFLFIEAIRGKPVDQEKEGFVHMIGLIALMVLMVFVVFNDISRLL